MVVIFCKFVVPEKIHTEKIDNTPLWTSYTNFRHSLDDSTPPLSGRRKFPLWVRYGFFLERPNI